LQFPLTACPGLFYNTLAQDGFLCRLRIPGGMINSQQFEAIADISDHYGGGYIDITNRANIQIREIKQEINIQVLEKLQALGLASTNARKLGKNILQHILIFPNYQRNLVCVLMVEAKFP